MTKVAITGATGFVGRHVLAELASRDLGVVATRRSHSLDEPHLANVEWVNLDLSSAPGQAFEALGRPDVLIHLAWGGLPNYRSLRHFEVELPAHYAFLRQLTDAGLKSLLVAGTCVQAPSVRRTRLPRSRRTDLPRTRYAANSNTCNARAVLHSS
jgi:nucleoside-diphosphate-sugar epimerase